MLEILRKEISNVLHSGCYGMTIKKHRWEFRVFLVCSFPSTVG
jgi:hypothetical protein